MSANIVSKKHIDAIVDYAAIHKFSIPSNAVEGIRAVAAHRHSVGQILWHENYKSVNYRYQENNECPRYLFAHSPGIEKMSVVQFLKHIKCLDYQSCEHGGWKDSQAKAILTSFIDQAISKMPGYEEASWGID